METKITGLTPLNVKALSEVFSESAAHGALVLTATTATWTNDTPLMAIFKLDKAMAELSWRGHPRHSLHAVRRKLVNLANLPGKTVW